ncbi:MAG: phage shock protein PspA [Gammaproteobacteria bacterium]|nr:phage shock protein PspA [Gammaproteobacteria bacterium]
MKVFKRVADIMNANIHAMLDKAEDPPKMVRMIIHEMNDTLVKVRMTAAKAIADRKELTRHLETKRAEAMDWERKAEYAVRRDRDDLARGALAERRQCEQDVENLERDLQVSEEIEGKLRNDIATLEGKIAEAKARQRSIIARAQTARVQRGVRRQLSRHNVDEIMEGFEQYERMIDDLEGQVESFESSKSMSLREEFQSIQDDEELDEELQNLKSRMKRGNEPSSEGTQTS